MLGKSMFEKSCTNKRKYGDETEEIWWTVLNQGVCYRVCLKELTFFNNA
jgi:hypothetical protein